MLLLAVLSHGADKRPLTIGDSIETTRAMVDWKGRPIFVSPDRRRFVAMLIHGDVKRDGIMAELVMGRLDSLDSAANLETIARVFTRGLGPITAHGEGSTELTQPGRNPPMWLDNDRVAFLWNDDAGVNQAVSVNVNSHDFRYLTHHPTAVTSFGLDSRGSLIYDAAVVYSHEKSEQLIRDGFVVTNDDALTLISGDADGTSTLDRKINYERFVSTPDHPEARRIAVAGGGINRWYSLNANGREFPPNFSRDGRSAIVEGTPTSVPPEWAGYTHPYFKDYLFKESLTNPRGWRARQISQLFVVDVDGASARPLWNAPMQTMVDDPPMRIEWSPGSRTVLLGPTFLPVDRADSAGLEAKAIVEVDVATGKSWRVPVAAESIAKLKALEWLSGDVVKIELTEGRSLQFKKSRDEWYPVSEAGEAVPNARGVHSDAVRIEMRQDLNTPPSLVAVDLKTGLERQILDLNPGLRTDILLGRVEIIHWNDSEGRRWGGRLYYPVNQVQGRRYPLVIQTHGFASRSEFSIYGQGGIVGVGLGPGWATYLAQPLAGRGIAVLQTGTSLHEPPEEGGPESGPAPTASGEPVEAIEIRAMTAAREAAIEYLVKAGVVDRARVGLQAHSFTGRQLEHAITFSEFPYAAAIASDYGENNYMQETLLWAKRNDFTESPPFGEALKAYLENSPAFNVQRIRTPLQIQVTASQGGLGAVLFNGWEMFSRMRFLKRPVELYVLPDILHGSHLVQNPRQILAIQQRALDWWCFWLKDESSADPTKAQQNAQWRVLRERRDAVLKETRPPILKWTAAAEGTASLR